MKRTFKHYLKLNQIQKNKLDKTLELCCWLYNCLLEQFRERDQKRERQPSEYQLINSLVDIKKEYLKLKEVNSTNLQTIAKQVHKTWQKYKELKKLDPKKGYPKFKPLHRYNSMIYNQPLKHVRGCGYKIDNSLLTKKKETRKLKLALGQQNNHNVYLNLKIVMERNIQGDVKTLTIKRKNGRYYACFSCDNLETRPLPQTNQNMGIDVNLNKQSYITLSNGKKYKHPQYYKKSEKKLKEANRNLSRKKEKSQNWKDAKLSLAKRWEKVVNQSKYYSRQVAKELVNDYDKIAIEDLKIKKMVKNRTLAKSIQQARWGILFQVISEAAEIATRELVRVNPKNTSQTCSDCRELLKEKLKPNQRIFRCWNCEFELDRDINSAKNILNLAEMGSTRTLLRNGENNF